MTDAKLPPWSQWFDAASLNDGIVQARKKLPSQWRAFQTSDFNRAVAYGDDDSTIVVAEVCDQGPLNAPKWRYRVRA